MDEDFEEIVSEKTLTLPSLNVNVDFNDLAESKGVLEALNIISDLKDLLK